MSEKSSYHPNPDELLSAYSHMTAEQTASSQVRETFLTHEDRIKEMPQDIKYLLERTSKVTGQICGEIHGTFGDHEIAVRKSSWDKGKTWSFAGTVDGEEVTPEETKTLYDDLYPVVEAYDEMQKHDKQAVDAIKNESYGKEQDWKLAIKDASEASRRVGYEIGEKYGVVKGELTHKLETMTIDDQDRPFFDNLINKVAEMKASSANDTPYDAVHARGSGAYVVLLNQINRVAFRDPEIVKKNSEEREYFSRLFPLVLELLGANKTNPEKYISGFADTELQAKVYPTNMPDVVVRLSHDKREVGAFDNESGSRLTVERNTKYVNTGIA